MALAYANPTAPLTSNVETTDAEEAAVAADTTSAAQRLASVVTSNVKAGSADQTVAAAPVAPVHKTRPATKTSASVNALTINVGIPAVHHHRTASMESAANLTVATDSGWLITVAMTPAEASAVARTAMEQDPHAMPARNASVCLPVSNACPWVMEKNAARTTRPVLRSLVVTEKSINSGQKIFKTFVQLVRIIPATNLYPGVILDTFYQLFQYPYPGGGVNFIL